MEIFMPERHDFGRLRRIAAAVSVLFTVAVALRFAAPDASIRGDLRTWFQSAVSLPEGPSPRGFDNIVSQVKPAVFGIRAKVTEKTASTDDQEPGFLPRFGETPDDATRFVAIPVG
jgi:hypothetical protein